MYFRNSNMISIWLHLIEVYCIEFGCFPNCFYLSVIDIFFFQYCFFIYIKLHLMILCCYGVLKKRNEKILKSLLKAYFVANSIFYKKTFSNLNKYIYRPLSWVYLENEKWGLINRKKKNTKKNLPGCDPTYPEFV